MNSIMDHNRKRMDSLSNKSELIEDKVRLLVKDVAVRVKVEELEQIKQTYLSSETALCILKKS